MTKLTKCLRLNLTNTLSGNVKLLTNFFQSSCTTIIHTKTKTEHLLFSLCQSIQHFIQLLFQQCRCCCLCWYRNIVILNKITQVAVFLFTDRCLQRHRFL